jgi:hypothetical protein
MLFNLIFVNRVNVNVSGLFKVKTAANVNRKRSTLLQVIHLGVKNVAVTLLGLLVVLKYAMKKLDGVYVRNV